jgi:hypothetical protein
MTILTLHEKKKLWSGDPLKPTRFKDVALSSIFYRLADSDNRAKPLRKDSKSFALVQRDLLIRIDPNEEVFVL